METKENSEGLEKRKQILGNIGSGHHQIIRDKRKN